MRLSCTGAGVPAFTVDEANLPQACAGTTRARREQGRHGRHQPERPELQVPAEHGRIGGFDRVLPWNIIASVEGLYRHAINGVRIRDLNFNGPRMVGGSIYTDKNGRVLYADTISAAGAITNINAALCDRGQRHGLQRRRDPRHQPVEGLQLHVDRTAQEALQRRPARPTSRTRSIARTTFSRSRPTARSPTGGMDVSSPARKTTTN